jgi:hypothetical protein
MKRITRKNVSTTSSEKRNIQLVLAVFVPSWAIEHLARCPTSAGSAGGHRSCSLSVALRRQVATSLLWLYERHSQ